MVNLVLKNIKDVENSLQDDVKKKCEEKKEYFDNLFKNYDKDLTLEIIFDKSSALYKVSASINLKSKKILIAEENNEVIKAVNKLFSDFKKTVKKQYELEKKEYEYKRKRNKKK